MQLLVGRSRQALWLAVDIAKSPWPNMVANRPSKTLEITRCPKGPKTVGTLAPRRSTTLSLSPSARKTPQAAAPRGERSRRLCSRA